MTAVARKHSQADCPGTFARAYRRAGRKGGFEAIGYVCTACRTYIFDEDTILMRSPSELRPAIEAATNEIVGLLADRAIQTGVESIVRRNPALRAKAESGNRYLNASRRWWAIASALVLRRHVDTGTPRTIRSIVEQLTEFERTGQTATLAGGGNFEADLLRLEELSTRFRPYLTAVIHGGNHQTGVTFDDLNRALDELRDIAERAYAAICKGSRPLEPVVMDDWAEIFRQPWIRSGENYAYEVGADGVPFDAVPLPSEDAPLVAQLEMRFESGGHNETNAIITNRSDVDAIDLRLFVPHMRTAVQEPVLRGGQATTQAMRYQSDGDPRFGYGQAVIEFQDGSGHVYRQYADVDLQQAISTNFTKPYRVRGRIVAPQQGVVEVT